jgi:hypothetical protein
MKITYKKGLDGLVVEGEERTQGERNLCSGVKTWVEYNGKTMDSDIGPELTENYQVYLKGYLAKYPENTRRKKKSYINKFRRHCLKLNEDMLLDINPQNYAFREFVTTVLQMKGIKLVDASKEIGSTIIYSWINKETMPTSKSKESLEKLSLLLGFENDFLFDNYVSNEPKWDFSEYTALTDYQIKMKKLIGDKYLLSRSAFSDRTTHHKLWEDYQLFFEYKTSPFLPPNIIRTKKQKWSAKEDGSVGASVHYETSLRAYFGFLLNVEKKDDLRLIDVLNRDLTHKFINFFIKRQGGRETKSVRIYLDVFRNISRYYLQYSERFRLKKKNVQEIIDFYSSRISMLDYVKTKNMSDNIKPFLDMDEPLEPFLDLIKNLMAEFNKGLNNNESNKNLAIILRNIVLISTALQKPLRPENFAKAKIGKNFYRDNKNGIWHLRFSEREVKNKKAQNKALEKKLTWWIDKYINEYRQYLVQGNSNDYVFLTQYGEPYSSSTYLSNRVYELTKRYFNFGVCLYSFRHLRATQVLKQNPGNYMYVAMLLGDSLTTVIKNYSHLEESHISKPDDDYFEKSYR